MSLEACLPAELRGPATTITRIAAGRSGAGVYRVDAPGRALVLKIADGEPAEDWRTKVGVQQLAAAAGLAPTVIHTDEERRAVVSELVVDRSFAALVMTPQTRDAAIDQLGQMLRRVHELPLPPGVRAKDLRALLSATAAGLERAPAFVGEATRRVGAEEPPACDRVVLSHNDVNPTNLVYDGQRLLLLDWESAGANDPYFDLAAIAVFLRFDDATCAKLIAAHDGAPISALPARFAYDRRFVAVLCGAMFLHQAQQRGHRSDPGDEGLGLVEFYQRMRSGGINLATAEGAWAFGLALVKVGSAL